MARKRAKPRLLAGGNPQIPKGYGDEPVQAYIAAIPSWKRDVARRLDAIITRVVPNVAKAVKYNSPLYGVELGGGWFLGIHLYTNYVKVAFFRGAALRPLPPGESRQKHTRYYDVREGELDETQFSKWVRQASKLPGQDL